MGNKGNEAFDCKDGGNCKNDLDKDEAANSIWDGCRKYVESFGMGL